MISIKSIARITARWYKEKPNWRKTINKATHKSLIHHGNLQAVYKKTINSTASKAQRCIQNIVNPK